MVAKAEELVELLASRHRVVVLGGIAVIGHGFTRPTADSDIWLDPMSSSGEWVTALIECLKNFKGLSVHSLPGWQEVSDEALVEAVEEVGLVRVQGLDQPVDIFRRPNEYDIEDFPEVLERAVQGADGIFLPDALDLVRSKLDTGRDKDWQDILFLENKVRAEYLEKLPKATVREAKERLERFCEPRVLEAALLNPSKEVQELALTYLQEFADAGDPFSQAILEGRGVPPSH